MANENEDIKNESTEEEKKHHTWVGDIVEKIEETIANLDGDFPLSGGDEPSLHTHAKTQAEIEEDEKKAAERKASIDQFLKVDFPLSGGEEKL